MGTDQKKTEIKKKITFNLFLVFIITPLFFVVFTANGNVDKTLGFRLINFCFGDKQNEQDFIEFFNVGQGDCTLIKSEDSAALIDSGIKSDNNKIYTNLLKRNIKCLEIVVITHHHQDHMGDFLNLIQNMQIKRLVINTSSAEDGENNLYNKVIEAAIKSGTEIISPKIGSVYKFGNAEIKVLMADNLAQEENNRSIVMMVNMYGKNILFTGDCDSDTEQSIYQNNNVKCDILKLGHHGSASSSYTEFLNAASPKFAIASCGYDNLYNHPSDDAVSRVNEQGITLLRTDLDRNIRVDFNSRDNTFNITTERGVEYVGVR